MSSTEINLQWNKQSHITISIEYWKNIFIRNVSDRCLNEYYLLPSYIPRYSDIQYDLIFRGKNENLERFWISPVKPAHLPSLLKAWKKPKMPFIQWTERNSMDMVKRNNYHKFLPWWKRKIPQIVQKFDF